VPPLPTLFKWLTVKDCVITINTIGHQKNIAVIIIERVTDYIFMGKDNHQELKEQQVKKLKAVNHKNLLQIRQITVSLQSRKSGVLLNNL
jgi:predicted transposase YbfD/YdcC